MRWPAGALALLALLPGCGTHSREAQVRAAMRAEPDATARAGLRGQDPLVALNWLVSASNADSAEQALALVDRGLSFLPGQPDLTWMRLSLLSQLGQRPAQLAAATESLGRAPPAALVPELLSFRLDAKLAAGDVAGAEAEATALGAVSGADQRPVAAAWAAIALMHELDGRSADADRTFEASLASGPRGLLALRQQAGTELARIAAGAALVQRAAVRHPQHPDLHLDLAVQAMLAERPDAARDALDALPEPLPARLVPDREALYARLDMLQGHIPEALARLRARLDRDPAETGALAVLLECWRGHAQPADDEMAARLYAALGRVQDPGLAGALQAALKEIEARRLTPTPPDPTAAASAG